MADFRLYFCVHCGATSVKPSPNASCLVCNAYAQTGLIEFFFDEVDHVNVVTPEGAV